MNNNTIKIATHDIEYIRLDNSYYGNPRYYIPLTSVMQLIPEQPSIDDAIRYINKNRISSLHVYRGKKYGYGYTIESYSLEHTLLAIATEFIKRSILEKPKL